VEDIGHWTFASGKLDVNKYIGFTYIINCTLTQKWYVGAKMYRTKCGNGRYRRENWKDYTSSSKPLNHAIKTLGKEYFTFSILSQYKTKRELYYSEAKEILSRDAILDDNSFNEWVSLKYRNKKPNLSGFAPGATKAT
jgi:hypothetical protein